MAPTRTSPLDLPNLLFPRQATATVTVAPNADSSSTTQTTTLSGGAIAGIVIGSIVGFLLLIWIIRSCRNLGAPPTDRQPQQAWYDDDGGRRPSSAIYRGSSRPRHGGGGSHHRHHHHRRRSSRSPRPVIIEKSPVRGSRSPRRMEPAVIYDDRRSRRGSSRSGQYYTSS